MGFTGLVPSEYSCGDAVRRGHITKAGNTHLRTQLIESAWAYQHHPNLGVMLRRRQEHVDAATPPGPGVPSNACAGGSGVWVPARAAAASVAVAIARELAGFLWAEMTAA